MSHVRLPPLSSWVLPLSLLSQSQLSRRSPQVPCVFGASHPVSDDEVPILHPVLL
jgi:hypothetical protein